MQAKADRLHGAITATIAAGDRITPDLGGSGNTDSFSEAIISRI
jgi:isocitrate dehydrogenase (NAD+)